MSYDRADHIADWTEGVRFTCPEDPVRLAGAPIGQYHCPWCGCMQLAGIPHLPHDVHCWLGLWDPYLRSETTDVAR